MALLPTLYLSVYQTQQASEWMVPPVMKRSVKQLTVFKAKRDLTPVRRSSVALFTTAQVSA
jgi:hypothetical protein